MGLLPPLPDQGRHECAPPMVEKVYLLPDAVLRPQDRGKGVGHRSQEVPDAGTTWDCPGCGRVWESVWRSGRGRSRYGQGYSPDRRVWVHASRRTAKEHIRRVLHQPPPPPPPPPPVSVVG